MNSKEDFETDVELVMQKAFDIFKERNKDYGLSHSRHGEIMTCFFPDGLQLNNSQDFTRFMFFNWIVGKLNRYAENFSKGGHADSIFDCINACAMFNIYDKNFEDIKNEIS